jgi:hypothetical protein
MLFLAAGTVKDALLSVAVFSDYEFQVCIIEALFRLIIKAERPKAASKWFSGHLQLYPELMKVRDQFFETVSHSEYNLTIYIL